MRCPGSTGSLIFCSVWLASSLSLSSPRPLSATCRSLWLRTVRLLCSSEVEAEPKASRRRCRFASSRFPHRRCLAYLGQRFSRLCVRSFRQGSSADDQQWPSETLSFVEWTPSRVSLRSPTSALTRSAALNLYVRYIDAFADWHPHRRQDGRSPRLDSCFERQPDRS